MSTKPLDALARPMAMGSSRRGSLLTLGGAGLAALAAPLAGSAKNKKKCKQTGKKCQRQVGQCNGYFVPLCEDEDAPEDCVELTAACCELLGDCQADAFIDCFLTTILRPSP
jgi:hypothetical protein